MNIVTRCAMMAGAILTLIAPAHAQPAFTGAAAGPVIQYSDGSPGAWQHGELTPLAVSQSSGSIFFSTKSHSLFNNSRGNRVALGLQYDGAEIGVQGLEITLQIPSPFLDVKNVTFGSAIESPGDWTLDYNVSRSASGSTVKIIAYGRDTMVNLGAGRYDDLFRIIFDVNNVRQEKPGVPFATAEIMITDVASALAHSLGHSAGIAPSNELSQVRFRIFSSVGVPIINNEETTSVEGGDDGRAMQSGGEMQAAGVGHAAGSLELTVAGMPNPFSGSTTVRYTLAAPATVSIVLSDAFGRSVARFADGEARTAGEHAFVLDGGNLAPGMYFCTVTAGGVSRTSRLVYTP